MEPRWINMYGILPSERKPGNPQSGSSFIGRVLVSLHLTENERP